MTLKAMNVNRRVEMPKGRGVVLATGESARKLIEKARENECKMKIGEREPHLIWQHNRR